MAAVKIQRKNCLQSTLRKKMINTLFAGLGRSVLGKTVPSVLGTAQFFPIRTSRPANNKNIYFAPNGEYCLYYPSNLFRNAQSFQNWGIFSDIPQFQLGNIRSRDAIRPIAHADLMDYKQQPPFGAKIWSDICPRILSVLGSEQFFESEARGKLCATRNRQCPRTNMRAYFRLK